jgi:hypothetical protein
MLTNIIPILKHFSPQQNSAEEKDNKNKYVSGKT